VDLSVFLGSALVSFALVGLGAYAGWLDSDAPDWTWVSTVLLIDVAHVYATLFRVYFDPAELVRRTRLYLLVPGVSYLLCVLVYSLSWVWFWRILAYLAVFHFVRQQAGWVALYRARCRETDRVSGALDQALIYLATIYPLLYWHAHLPRDFDWFLPGDFLALPRILAQVAGAVYAVLIVLYAWTIWQRWQSGRANPGKDLVIATTAACWYFGIVVWNSEFAFTVTNVIIHGVPYFALTVWYQRMRKRQTARGPVPTILGTWWGMLLTVWLCAYVEELCWDRSVWHERGWLFGPPWAWPEGHWLWVPLLAVPQVTHYVLDGFIWRRKSNPVLQELFGDSGPASLSDRAIPREGPGDERRKGVSRDDREGGSPSA